MTKQFDIVRLSADTTEALKNIQEAKRKHSEDVYSLEQSDRALDQNARELEQIKKNRNLAKMHIRQSKMILKDHFRVLARLLGRTFGPNLERLVLAIRMADCASAQRVREMSLQRAQREIEATIGVGPTATEMLATLRTFRQLRDQFGDTRNSTSKRGRTAEPVALASDDGAANPTIQ
jgi:hypothetical protein